MCGIAGCFGVQDTRKIDQMLDALRHRGPNDRGLHRFSSGVFGHTRLSIVDVAGGHQPMVRNEGRLGIVCNGEIYNYRELKERIPGELPFRTNSDTETILNLYRHKGPGCVADLDGMFAFAIMDGEDIMLARDPVGIKPLYYGHHKGGMYFSSELGAMSLAQVDEVHEFPAGHYYTNREGFVEYYALPPLDDRRLSNIDEAAKAIRETFIRSVKKRLLADPEVPVGSFCSGGLDSSLVAAIAAEEIPNLHTFVVGMTDAHGDVGDDVEASRRAAEHIGSTHHEILFSENDYREALPEVINKLETYDPSLVRSAVPCYFTCKGAAEHVTVALTGEGADEVFTGYQYMKRLPLNKLNQEGRRLIETLHNINLQRADRMGMLFSLELRVPFLDEQMLALAQLIPPDLKIREVDGNKIEKWILRKAFEGTGYLPDDILWRYKVQYTQGAGCESLGEQLADEEISDDEYEKIKDTNPNAVINSKEAAYYYRIFRSFHPQDSILASIGIWSGFDFAEERRKVRGSMDALSHSRRKA